MPTAACLDLSACLSLSSSPPPRPSVSVQTVVPAFFFLAAGYQLCTPENLRWRRDQGAERANWIYTYFFGQLSTCTKVIAAVATIGLYLVLLGLACTVGFGSYFFSLPVEVCWPPLRLVFRVTYRATMVRFVCRPSARFFLPDPKGCPLLSLPCHGWVGGPLA